MTATLLSRSSLPQHHQLTPCSPAMSDGVADPGSGGNHSQCYGSVPIDHRLSSLIHNPEFPVDSAHLRGSAGGCIPVKLLNKFDTNRKDNNGRSKHSRTAETGTRTHRSGHFGTGATQSNRAPSGSSTEGNPIRAGRSTRTSDPECCRSGKNLGRTAGTVGEAKGQDCRCEHLCEEDGFETHTNESCREKEAVRNDEGKVGGEKESGISICPADCRKQTTVRPPPTAKPPPYS